MFWLFVSLLAAVTLAALLRPLLRERAGAPASSAAINLEVHRDQLRALEADVAAGVLPAEQLAHARREIERRALEDAANEPAGAASAPQGRAVGVAIALAILVPLGALGTYSAIGEPGAVDSAAASSDRQQFEQMAERLAARLKAQPDDADGWVMLGRSWDELGRFDEAVAAFAEAVARMPDDAAVLADYADSLGMKNGGNLSGEPERLIERALRADPSNVKALLLAGHAASFRGDFAAAIRHWERALQLGDDSPEFARAAAMLRPKIEEARAQRDARGKRSGASK